MTDRLKRRAVNSLRQRELRSLADSTLDVNSLEKQMAELFLAFPEDFVPAGPDGRPVGGSEGTGSSFGSSVLDHQLQDGESHSSGGGGSSGGRVSVATSGYHEFQQRMQLIGLNASWENFDYPTAKPYSAVPSKPRRHDRYGHMQSLPEDPPPLRPPPPYQYATARSAFNAAGISNRDFSTQRRTETMRELDSGRERSSSRFTLPDPRVNRSSTLDHYRAHHNSTKPVNDTNDMNGFASPAAARGRQQRQQRQQPAPSRFTFDQEDAAGGVRGARCIVCKMHVLDEDAVDSTDRWVHQECFASVCPICEQVVYPMEDINIESQSYHKWCAKCFFCNRHLNSGTINTKKSRGQVQLCCSFCLTRSERHENALRTRPPLASSPVPPEVFWTRGPPRSGSQSSKRSMGSVYQADVNGSVRSLSMSTPRTPGSPDEPCAVCRTAIKWHQSREIFSRGVAHWVCIKNTCPRCERQVLEAESVPSHTRNYHQECFSCVACGGKIAKGKEMVHKESSGEKLLFHELCFKPVGARTSYS